MPVDNPGNIVATSDDAHDLAYEESTPGDWGTKPRTVGKALDSLAAGGGLTSPVGIADGGTGQTTAQAAIDALSQVSGATNEHVLTKDTGTGNAKWKAAAGGTTTEIFDAVAVQSITSAATAITATDGSPYRLISSDAAYTLTAEPTIASGRNGELILVKNVGDYNVTLQDVNALGSSNLRFTANTLTIQPGGTLALVYDSTIGFWIQQYILNPQTFTPSIASFTVDGQSSALTHEWGDGSTANDTAPSFVASYIGTPSAADAWLDGAPANAFSSPYLTLVGAAYYRSATAGGTRSFQLHATVSGTGGLTSGTVTVTYRAPNYAGGSTTATGISDAALIAFADRQLDTNAYGTYSAIDTSGAKYVWFACPSGYTTPFFVIGGERAGFTLDATSTHVGEWLKSSTYKKFVSVLTGMGSGSVTLVTQSSDGQVRNYFGISTQATSLTSAQILGLAQSALDSDAYYAWSSIASGVSDYLWLAYPSSYTDPYFKEASSGERAGFTVKQTAFSHQNQYGYTLAGGYDTARSDIIDMPTAAYTTQSSRPPTRRYVGKAATTGPLSEATIKGLQLNDLTESPNGTFASITGLASGQSVWFCVSNANIAAPAHYGLSPGNGSSGYQEAAFTAAALVSVTNQYGYTENYKEIYSDVSELQAVTINAATNSTWSLKTQAAAFNNRIYMGPAPSTQPISNASILALDDTAGGQSNLNSSLAGTYNNLVVSGTNHFWLLHPDTVPDFSTMKFAGIDVDGAYEAGLVSHTNDFGVVENYRAWRSTNAGIFPTNSTIVIT